MEEKRQLREEKSQLREKERQLREEKSQLREKERQLREEKSQLREKERQQRELLILEKKEQPHPGIYTVYVLI